MSSRPVAARKSSRRVFTRAVSQSRAASRSAIVLLTWAFELSHTRTMDRGAAAAVNPAASRAKANAALSSVLTSRGAVGSGPNVGLVQTANPHSPEDLVGAAANHHGGGKAGQQFTALHLRQRAHAQTARRGWRLLIQNVRVRVYCLM